MSLTPGQQKAITARGNVLVVAGAGTGKTRTLVERVLHCMKEEQPPASLDQLLVVTFTEAAAAEMRQRIRAQIERELESHPHDLHWHEQLGLFDTARIGTLHSFCLELVRQHFYALELDPQLAVLSEEEARLLALETLDKLLIEHYAGHAEYAADVHRLIHTHGGGRDGLIRELVLKLHHYSQTLPNPAGWLQIQIAGLDSADPADWRKWLIEAVAAWRHRWLPVLEALAATNSVAAASARALENLAHPPARSQAAAALQLVASARDGCPQGKKTAWIKPIEKFFSGSDFLLSLASVADSNDPLIQDWEWVRPGMAALVQLTRQFTHEFGSAKREQGVVDFHDLEQHALKLLWDFENGQPTSIARAWREQLRFVFVDEYQDINAAQDRILEALSRPGPGANRFLVGDARQSIYRFRLADPYIFQKYASDWRNGSGQVLPLADNFRSQEAILNFVNSFFEYSMSGELGGIAFGKEDELKFGEPAERAALSVAANPGPRTELHLRVKTAPGAAAHYEPGEENEMVAELEEAEQEARVIARRLLELKSQPFRVWDETAKAFRDVQWKDMAVLLRAPAGKSESYAREFSRWNIPLRVARGGFYESLEVSDLLNLLRLLDNPLQDLPALAVLRSPLVGLTLDELADIRTAAPGRFWSALVLWSEAGYARGSPESRRKIERFLERFGRWRRLARQAPLSRCLEQILTETHFTAWLMTQPRATQRQANLQHFLHLAQQFDHFKRQGLYRFLRFVEAQQEAGTEPNAAAVETADAVQLMSIHQSKGLEFPVVVVADLAKPFNLMDQRAEVILDPVYGLCPRIKPPHTGNRYPSLPHWLARQRQHREMLGEELRLLYVAATRARDVLLLSASLPQNRLDRFWQPPPASRAETLLAANCFADWLAPWFAQNCAPATLSHRMGEGLGVRVQQPAVLEQGREEEGENHLLRWFIHRGLAQVQPVLTANENSAKPAHTAENAGAPATLLHARLNWRYPFAAATCEPAKTSATNLRRRAEAAAEDDPIAALFPARTRTGREARAAGAAAETGLAHHSFLQFVDIARTGTLQQLKAEAARLESDGRLTRPQVASLNFDALAAFWNSEQGRLVRKHPDHTRREFEFTARFSPSEIAALTGTTPGPQLENEFVIVQGVADLAVTLRRELYLVDFKTDAIAVNELESRAALYRPQLKLYATALSRIYRRPVTGAWLWFLAPGKAVSMQMYQAAFDFYEFPSNTSVS